MRKDASFDGLARRVSSKPARRVIVVRLEGGTSSACRKGRLRRVPDGISKTTRLSLLQRGMEPGRRERRAIDPEP